MKHIILLIDDKELKFEDWLKEMSIDLTDFCMAIIGYAEEKEEYTTFLPPEGTNASSGISKRELQMVRN
ncbi:MAG: hypothetical protein OEM28_02460 [Nitrosopumilus sp.]|nr:hypothetical protein [Nitrosopumilus sp.]MDH3486971.1 hypothetical protein [Nitrosopumilus sp.]